MYDTFGANDHTAQQKNAPCESYGVYAWVSFELLPSLSTPDMATHVAVVQDSFLVQSSATLYTSRHLRNVLLG